MAKDFALAFYRSKAWLDCRKAYISSVYGLCEGCNDGTQGRVVHHKILLTKDNICDPYISLNGDNLEYLCTDCHASRHSKEQVGTVEGVLFDSKGQLVSDKVEEAARYERRL